ncbi:MAG TPA: DNA polymerase III subunit epsilon, partial [Zoogloea sp.]|nr:DNA polymerase III subunit epsilon [Zoogloea sp.]
CALYEIDNTHRTLHGALLDAELLADVYLAMTRGQESLLMSLDEPPPRMDDGSGSGFVERPPLRVLRASPDELEGHERVLGEIAKANKGNCMWIPPAPPAPA